MSDVRFARACSAAFLRAFVFLVALAICKTLAHEPRKNHAGGPLRRHGRCLFMLQTQTPDRELFSDAVKRFYKEDESLLRGNCAENLAAWILETENQDERAELLDKFREQIEFWLKDDDCWVLDHMYRLFWKLAQEEQEEDFAFLLRSGIGTCLKVMGAYGTGSIGRTSWSESKKTKFESLGFKPLLSSRTFTLIEGFKQVSALWETA